MKKNSFCSTLIMVLISTFILSSCATLFTGTKDTIHFSTNPSGATIFINGVEQCKTPCTFRVKRNVHDTDVMFKLDGYDTRIITLSKEFNIISILNLGNLFGWAIDILSGAVMRFDRKAYDITLDSKKTSMIHPSKININTKEKIVEIYVVESE